MMGTAESEVVEGERAVEILEDALGLGSTVDDGDEKDSLPLEFGAFRASALSASAPHAPCGKTPNMVSNIPPLLHHAGV